MVQLENWVAIHPGSRTDEVANNLGVMNRGKSGRTENPEKVTENRQYDVV